MSDTVQCNPLFARFAFAFAAVVCLLGVFFCVIKSPHAVGNSYMMSSLQSLHDGDYAQAARTITLSAQANPSSLESWRVMAKIMEDNGEYLLSRQALSMAHKIESQTTLSNPVYAMPADLRLSFLAASNTEPR